MADHDHFVYILICSDGTYYVGKARDLGVRLAEHDEGLDPTAYTFLRRPVRLAWSESFDTEEDAFAAEQQIKGWSRAKKEALIYEGLEAVHRIVLAERRRRESQRRARSRARNGGML